MSKLVLKVNLEKLEITKTFQFEPSATVKDVIDKVHKKVPESVVKGEDNFGIFYSPNNDPAKSTWLETDRTLGFYNFTNGEEMIYRNKNRLLKVKMLDGSVKTVMVDDSKTVAVALQTICDKVAISNVDEFSLLIEEEEAKDGATGTLSRRDKSMSIKHSTLMRVEEREKKKMDTLKRKLHTEDNTKWLDHERTLRECGVIDNTIVILRRKLIYEKNANIKNPVEINLLYSQSRDAILEGVYPCPMEDAAKFAALTIQIQYGDYDEGRYRSGQIDFKDALGKEYLKRKDVEKKVKEEHKLIMGLDALTAKYKYIQICQGLPTYGVTFFLVKEKMKGKNKLVPRLLGINKDDVLRVDEKTKQVLKTWPLTQVKRWAASPKSFTLDFGDYTEGYYSVQTQEADQIANLISGYVDIILKKRKALEFVDDDQDEQGIIKEDNITPHRSTTVVRNKAPKKPKSHQQNEQPSMGMNSGQKALMDGINDNRKIQIEDFLTASPELPVYGSDPQSQRWLENQQEFTKNDIANRLAATSAAVAGIVSATSGDPDDVNYTEVGAGVSVINSNLEDLMRGLRMFNTLIGDEDDSNGLLKAARNLSDAFGNFLGALDPTTGKPRQDLLNYAGEIGLLSAEIMNALGDPNTDADFEDLLLRLAKAVATAAAQLVLQAKNVAENSDEGTRDEIIDAAKQTALTTSQLVACTKVLAPHMNSPICQQQMVEAAKLVDSSVDNVQGICLDSTDDENSQNLIKDAAAKVSDALNNLLNQIGNGGKQPEDQYDDILNASDKLFNSMGNADEMVRQAKILAQANSLLVNGIQGAAEGEDDDDSSKRLLAAAKVLADATAQLVDAAKGTAKNPNDQAEQERLRRAAEDLAVATNAATQNALKKKLIKRLENAARQAVASSTQLITASKAAGPTNKNPASQQQLSDSCKPVNDQCHDLIASIKDSQKYPDHQKAQLGLITASKNFIPPGNKLVANSKAAVPTVADNAAALQLTKSGKNTQVALDELRSAADKAAEACGSLEIDEALNAVKILEEEIREMREAANHGQLRPLPNDDADEKALEVAGSAKTVGANMAQLLTAAAQGNDSYTGIAARDTANALKALTNAVRGVAATSGEPSDQQAILKAAQVVMNKSAQLIAEAKHALEDPNDPENQQNLAHVAREVSRALSHVVGCLPGQRVVERAIDDINAISKALGDPNVQFPYTEEPFSAVQERLNETSLALNTAANDVVHAAKGTSGQLAKASENLSHTYGDVQYSGLALAGKYNDRAAQDQLVDNLRNTSNASSKLLLASKALAADPGAPNAKNLLAAAAKGVTDAINQLLDQVLTSAPGQKECDQAIRNIEGLSHVLDNPVEPVNEASFFECLDSAAEKSQDMTKAVQDLSDSLKKEDTGELVNSVGVAADAVCNLTESTAQAAYLVAIADPSSTMGQAGLVDQSQFAKARDAIRAACDGLLSDNAKQQQILSAASVIAKHTAILCNACKQASTKTNNPVAKRHFVQSAKDVATNTANIAKFIKAYAVKMTPDNRRNCADAAEPLLEAVDNLVAFASSPEFASVPAKISPQAKAAQQPLISSGKNMVNSSTKLFLAAKQLANNNKDPQVWNSFTQYARAVSDAMKKIVFSLRENAPGQQECDQAGDMINRAINKIDQASLSAVSNNLRPDTQGSLKEFEEKLMLICAQLQESVPDTVDHAKGAPEKIGHSVIKLANLADPLADCAIGFASKLPGGSQKQTELLDKAKTVCESAASLVYATKDAGGNPKARETHPAVDEAAVDLDEAINDLTQQLEETASDTGAVTALVDSIKKARTGISMFVADYRDRSHGLPPGMTFVEYQDKMVKGLKNITRNSQDMVSKSNSKPKELGGIAQDMCKNYNLLAEDTKYAVLLTNQPDIADRLKTSVDTLGDSCSHLVVAAGNVQSSPNDSYAKRDLSDKAKQVNENVSYVLATLQAGSIGTQACIDAVNTLNGIIGDLDTTIMFAQAGTLNPETGSETFGELKENMLKTARDLVEDTKSLVVGAQGSQEQLATSAQKVLASMTSLADKIKLGATSLGSDDVEAQVMLLQAAKDVAYALTDLVNATKNSSGKSATDPAMEVLKVSAKTMVTNVSSLLKTIHSVEDEASRGVRAIEATVDAVKQAVVELQNGSPPYKDASPEELIRATKGVTLATAKAVSAGNSGKQDDVLQAANIGRRFTTELLVTLKGAVFNADNESVKISIMMKGRETAEAYCDVLNHVASIVMHPSQPKKQQLVVLSKQVAVSVSDLVKQAEQLKGDYVNPNDPNVIAENELLGAAASIEAAARKLAELKPRARPKAANEDLNFEEQIVEAAKSITAAAGALVKAATAAQRELVATGRVDPKSSWGIEKWSQGLIDAARLVAAATGSLCEAAHATVQGDYSEHKLINSAKSVADSTEKLLIACQSKADKNSNTQRGLQNAGHAVKSATEILIKAATGSDDWFREQDDVNLNQSMDDDYNYELELQEMILKKQRELEASRRKLTIIKNARYRGEEEDEDEML
ncbi:talin-2-like isoform X1 [Clytia hemisphaerica]|uniref:Talin n=1 Tax=Clytia hemisphaerica TaxID=252671 RepID=A0A7M5V8R0_9CNID